MPAVSIGLAVAARRPHDAHKDGIAQKPCVSRTKVGSLVCFGARVVPIVSAVRR